MKQHSTNGRLWRSRWAAIGAAVAVTIGGGGLFAAHAADESSVITIDPVRIVDTRVDLGITGPLKSLVPQDVKVTGMIATAEANQIVVPEGANGIVMNLGIIRPTARGFISARAGGATGTATTTSHNFEEGETSGNAVIVTIPTTGAHAGELNLTFNAYEVPGPIVEVTVDIVGYTLDNSVSSLAGRISALEDTKPITASSAGDDVDLNDDDAVATVVDTVSLVAPAGGSVTVHASTSFYNNAAAERGVRCSISLTSDPDLDADRVTWVRATSAGSNSMTRSFSVASGATFTANLVCTKTADSVDLFQVIEPEMTALYIAD